MTSPGSSFTNQSTFGFPTVASTMIILSLEPQIQLGCARMCPLLCDPSSSSNVHHGSKDELFPRISWSEESPGSLLKIHISCATKVQVGPRTPCLPSTPRIPSSDRWGNTSLPPDRPNLSPLPPNPKRLYWALRLKSSFFQVSQHFLDKFNVCA